MDSYSLTLNIEPNTTSSERDAEVIFINRNDNTKKDTLNIRQLSSELTINKEKEALIALYNVTSGDNWTNNTNWCSNEPLNSWYGVTTDAQDRVVNINLQNNNLKGQLPDKLDDLSNLEVLNLSQNVISGEVKDAIKSFRKLTTLNLSNNYLFGDILPYITDNQSLEYLSLADNGFTGTIPREIMNLNSLKSIYLYSNSFSGSIPEELFNITSLERINLDYNNFSGSIPENIGNLVNLYSLSIYKCKLSGGLPNSIINILDNPNIFHINLSLNFLSGTLSQELFNHPKFYVLSLRHISRNDSFYIEAYKSKDFSKDKEVELIYAATKGAGVPLVIMGDGFVDTLITNGSYDYAVEKAIEYYFDIEPAASLKEYFNIYKVTAVSTNNSFGTSNCNTALGVSYGSDGRYVAGSTEKVLEYASLIPDYNAEHTKIIVIANSDKSGGTVHFVDDTRTTISYCSKSIDGYNSDNFRYLIQHEGVGHGLGLLGDEYFTPNITYPEILKVSLRTNQALGRYLNLDITNDPNEVLWSKFLSDTRYANDNLGIFEGGDGNYGKGVWRPSQTSIMEGHDPWFNAPSRESIYIQVMKTAFGESWQYDYETFVQFDMNNIIQ